MASVEEEKSHYEEYSWQEGGHEWSGSWGTTSDLWAVTIYRRIFPLLKAGRILEIAPGFGRWTPYLIANSDEYLGVDIAERCVSACRRTFGALTSRPRFIQGNGYGFPEVADGSVDLVFSFDSLVHLDLACLKSYATEICRVLRRGGHAFVHHSNLGEYVVDGVLTTDNPYRRDASVTAEAVAVAMQDAGLVSLAHEKIQWIESEAYNDCFSLVTRPFHSDPEGHHDLTRVFRNSQFKDEVIYSKALAARYTDVLASSVR
jgi:SAM-dependent methyltransferase